MRIGILSYPLNNNYGCYLQAYALLTTLQRMGHEVTYIYRRHNVPGIGVRLKYFVKTLMSNLRHLEWENPIYRYEWLYMLQKGEAMMTFFEKHIPHTEAIYTSRGLKKKCREFDALVVGSDQVWRAGLLHHIEDYFLEFLGEKNTIRISYAASFGKRDAGYTPAEIERCGQLIRRFRAVSVRESMGLEMLHDFGWSCEDAKVVLDPTLLLDKNDYIQVAEQSDKHESLFCYILDSTDDTTSVIREVSEQLNMPPEDILKGRKAKSYRYKSVGYWLGCFCRASFVVTDSFHGTVFSIIFNVPFVVVSNSSRGTDRIVSLLRMVNLEDRIYSGIGNLSKQLSVRIDWGNVNKTIESEKLKSLSFLKEAIS